ncbi:lipase family protein [Anaerovibrio sp.]|uniref:lipase family protein n=1 Tax=Anaerovibrio sp. TaxID=1872532 RepID=UPI003F18F042
MRVFFGFFCGAFLCLALLLGGPAMAGAQAVDSVRQARMAYICALADMAVYSSSMNEAVRQEMSQFGWQFKDYRQADRRADTTFYTLVHEGSSGREALVVIPGTEKLKDVEVDLRFGKVLFGGSTPQEFRSFAETEKVTASQPMVHQGFNDYTMTAFFTPDADGVMGADRLRELAADGNEHLYLTGHSLGGAVATLLAARLVSMGVDPDKLSVFTFGAPTVGNTAFAEEYGYRIDLSRYTMGGDVVRNALQALKSGYVHFGTEYRWKKNENSHKFNHAIVGYLDAAIRGYYDEVLQGDLSMAGLAAAKEAAGGDAAQEAQEGKPVQSWRQVSSAGRVYIAPAVLDLPEDIANDSAYMQVVAGDILMHQFSRVVADDAYARPGAAVDALFAACRRAEEAGCDRVAMININGTADKENPKLYRLAVAVEVYTTTGEPLLHTINSTTTQEITPIEAVMYDMTRAVADIKEAQRQGILPE